MRTCVVFIIIVSHSLKCSIVICNPISVTTCYRL